MQNLENLEVFEILITQKLLKCPKDPFVRSALIFNCTHLRFEQLKHGEKIIGLRICISSFVHCYGKQQCLRIVGKKWYSGRPYRPSGRPYRPTITSD